MEFMEKLVQRVFENMDDTADDSNDTIIIIIIKWAYAEKENKNGFNYKFV